MAQTPSSVVYTDPHLRHLGVCAIYSETDIDPLFNHTFMYGQYRSPTCRFWVLDPPNRSCAKSGFLGDFLEILDPPTPNAPCMPYLPTLTPKTTPTDRHIMAVPWSLWVPYLRNSHTWSVPMSYVRSASS